MTAIGQMRPGVGAAAPPRSRGVFSGLLLVLLGIWGGIVPYVGPYFSFAFTPDKAWASTDGRLWLSVLPGLCAVFGGLIVMAARSPAAGGSGALLAALGGAWLILGRLVIRALGQTASISAGTPVALTVTRRVVEEVGFFYGTGILIVFFAALALGRFSAGGTSWAGAQPAADYSRYGEPAPGPVRPGPAYRLPGGSPVPEPYPGGYRPPANPPRTESAAAQPTAPAADRPVAARPVGEQTATQPVSTAPQPGPAAGGEAETQALQSSGQPPGEAAPAPAGDDQPTREFGQDS
jgi:hypothetical protein